MRKRYLGEEPEYKKKQKESKEHQERTKQYEAYIQSIAAVTAVIDRVANEQEATRNQQNRHEESKHKLDKTTICAISITAVVAMATLLVAHCDTNRVIEEAHTSSETQHTDTVAALAKTDKAIQESHQLAEAAAIQATAAQKSADLSENVERGRINIYDVVFKGDNASGPVTAEFRMKNIGRTTAILIAARLKVTGRPYWMNQQGMPPPGPLANFGRPKIYGNKSVDREAVMEGDPVLGKVDIMPPFPIKGVWWFFHGEVIYQDIFGNEWKKFFCFSNRIFNDASLPCGVGVGRFVSGPNDQTNREIKQQPGTEHANWPT